MEHKIDPSVKIIQSKRESKSNYLEEKMKRSVFWTLKSIILGKSIVVFRKIYCGFWINLYICSVYAVKRWDRHIYEGVYLTSCLLCSKLRNFRTTQEDEATVDVYEICRDMLHASYRRMDAYRIHISVGFLRCLSLCSGQCEGLERGISSRYSSHALFLCVLGYVTEIFYFQARGLGWRTKSL